MQIDSRALSPDQYTVADLIHHAQTQPQNDISSKSITSYASTLRSFVREVGFSEQSLAIDVLGEGLGGYLGQIADDKSRKSRLRKWQQLFQKLLIQNQKDDFSDLLKQAMTENSISVSQLGKALGIPSDTIKKWIYCSSMPRNIITIEAIEKQLGLIDGQLKQLALARLDGPYRLIPHSWWPASCRGRFKNSVKKQMATAHFIGYQNLSLSHDRLRPLFDEALERVLNNEHLPEWRKRQGELVQLEYRLKFEDWPPHIQKTWQSMTEYMTSPAGFHNEDRNGEWRQKTAKIYLVYFESYFGFLVLPQKNNEIRLTGLGISKESLGFVHAIDGQNFRAYAEFIKSRSGGYPTSLKAVLAVIRQLIRRGSGYFYSYPHLLENTAAFQSKDKGERQATLAELDEEMKDIQNKLKKWEGQLRETMSLITPILEHQRPRDLVLDAIEEYGYDLRQAHPIGQIATAGPKTLLSWDNYLLLHILIRFPLRLSHWSKMTYRKDNTGHFFYDKNGVLCLRLPYNEFKNEMSRRHFPKRDDGRPGEIILPFSEGSPLGEIRELAEFYLKQVRPSLAKGNSDYVFCNLRGKRRSEKDISAFIDIWSFRYLSTYGDKKTCIEDVYSFRTHMFRHIVATDAVKNEGVEAAAALLLDDPERILKNYARYLPEDGIRRAFSSKAIYRPGYEVRLPELVKATS